VPANSSSAGAPYSTVCRSSFQPRGKRFGGECPIRERIVHFGCPI